jgi:Tfp pilus assembly protein PilN
MKATAKVDYAAPIPKTDLREVKLTGLSGDFTQRNDVILNLPANCGLQAGDLVTIQVDKQVAQAEEQESPNK